MMGDSLTGAVLTNQDKTGLPCRGDDLGYFSKATFWLLAELVPRRMLKLPFWESFKPRDNWLGCGVASDHTQVCTAGGSQSGTKAVTRLHSYTLLLP